MCTPLIVSKRSVKLSCQLLLKQSIHLKNLKNSVKCHFREGTKYKFTAEVVETMLVPNGEFFQIELSADYNYALSVNTHHEIAPGKHDVVLARKIVDADSQKWKISDDRIESVGKFSI